MDTLYHHRIWSLPYTLLVRDPIEAAALYRILTRTFPELVSTIVMPDHSHLVLPHPDAGRRLQRAQAAYARWRNHHRRERGGLWAPPPPVEVVPRSRHFGLNRYLYLNANRKGLVADPLAWPWSSYRERIGLAFPLIGPLERNPGWLHRKVSSDETALIGGTPLPERVYRPVTWTEVVDAVLAVTRATPESLTRRGLVRTLAVQAAWVLGLRDVEDIGRATGLCRARIYGLVRGLPAAEAVPAGTPLSAAIRLVGDDRFCPWESLTGSAGWQRYAAFR